VKAAIYEQLGLKATYLPCRKSGEFTVGALAPHAA
jgi:hypothetical protein